MQHYDVAAIQRWDSEMRHRSCVCLGSPQDLPPSKELTAWTGEAMSTWTQTPGQSKPRWEPIKRPAQELWAFSRSCQRSERGKISENLCEYLEYQEGDHFNTCTASQPASLALGTDSLRQSSSCRPWRRWTRWSAVQGSRLVGGPGPRCCGRHAHMPPPTLRCWSSRLRGTCLWRFPRWWQNNQSWCKIFFIVVVPMKTNRQYIYFITEILLYLKNKNVLLCDCLIEFFPVIVVSLLRLQQMSWWKIPVSGLRLRQEAVKTAQLESLKRDPETKVYANYRNMTFYQESKSLTFSNDSTQTPTWAPVSVAMSRIISADRSLLAYTTPSANTSLPSASVLLISTVLQLQDTILQSIY